MKRTPEQEAARQERRIRTAAMRKCACGNVVSPGKEQCGACEPTDDFEMDLLEMEIQDLRSLGDLKTVLMKISELIRGLR